MRWQPKTRLNEKERSTFYYEMAALLEHGVAPLVGLNALYKQAYATKKNSRYTKFFEDVIPQVKNGGQLSEALIKWVPLSDRMIIAAGESGGKMYAPMYNISRNIESLKEIREALRSAFLGPIVEICLMLLVVYGIGAFAVPEFEKFAPKDTWTNPMALALLWFSTFISDYILFIVGLIVAVIAAIYWSFENLTGPYRVTLDKFAPWSVYRMYIGTQTLKAIGMLINAGVPPQKALLMVSRNASPWLAQRIEAASYQMRNGLNMGEAFQEAKHNFPDPAIISNLVIFSSLANMSNHVEMVADMWLKDGVKNIQKQSVVISVVMKLILAMMVVILIFAVVGMIADVMTGIMAKAGV